MKIIINDIQAFKLLMAAMAKEDPRFYLMGIHFDIPEKTAVATNGHLMFAASCISSSTINTAVTILFAKFAIPSKAKSILITEEEITVFSESDAQDTRLKIVPCSKLSQQHEFPNYEKLLIDINHQPSIQIGKLGINPDSLKCFGDCFPVKDRGLTLKLKNADSAIGIEFHAPVSSEYTCIVMPMRVDQGQNEQGEEKQAA